MKSFAIIGFASILGTAAAAQTAPGDPEKGAREFNKCKACHSITAPDGTAVVKGGRLGPNLYGVIGREIAAEAGFRYGAGLLALKAARPGAVWDTEAIEAYLADPTGYLEAQTGDPKARSKMTFRMNRGQADVAAYLLQNAPGAPPQVPDGNPAPVPGTTPPVP